MQYKIHRVVLTILLTIVLLHITANIFAMPLTIKMHNKVGSSNYGIVHTGFPILIDSTDNSFNKVVFKIATQKIEITKNDRLLQYIIVGNKNISNDTLSFYENYIKSLTNETAPKIKIDKQHYGGEYNIYFRPFTHATYNDARINDFPLEWSLQNIYTVNLDSTELEIIDSPEYKHIIVTKPEYKDRIINGKRTKDLYNYGDSIPLRNYSIQILSINDNDSTLNYLVIDNSDIPTIQLPRNLYEFINQSENQLIIIEFFGSWCSPCKDGIIKLKEIYLNNPHLFNIVTISCEYTNDYSSAEAFISDHQISWPVIYERLDEGNNLALDIHTWPYYLICNKEGKVLYATSVTNDIIEYIMNYEKK